MSFDSLDRKNAARLEQKKSAPRPPAKVEGVDTERGGYVVKQGADEYRGQQSISNGAIGTGQRVMRKGNTIDAMRRRKKEQPQDEPTKTYRKIKYLFSVPEGDKLVFYVGGHQARPVRVFELPASVSARGAINNLGSSKYSIDLIYDNKVERWQGRKKLYTLTTTNAIANSLEWRGHGFWTGVRSLPQNQSQFSTVWGGKITTYPPFTRGTSYSTFNDDSTTFPPCSGSRTITDGFTALGKAHILPDLMLDYSSKFDRSEVFDLSAPAGIDGNGVCVFYRHILDEVRRENRWSASSLINNQGTVAIASEYGFQFTNNVIGVVPQGSTQTYTGKESKSAVLFARDTQTLINRNSNSLTATTRPPLDDAFKALTESGKYSFNSVFDDGFSMLHLEKSVNEAISENKQAEGAVKRYNLEIEQKGSVAKLKIFLPHVKSNFAIYNYSYHP